MRIVVWNLSHWQKTEEQRRRAWELLRDDLKADVALLQETVPPKDAGSVVYRAIGGDRPWGSAVVGLTRPVDAVTHAKGRYNKAEVPIASCMPGSVAVGRCAFGGGSLVLVSVYGVIDNGYADTTVHRQLSDLVPLLDSPEAANLVLGGDLNITTQWSGKDARYARWETATFARIEALGLSDCLDRFREPGRLADCWCDSGDRCRHIRTQHHSMSQRPWQNDYAFASEKLMPRLISAAVCLEPDLRELSDHLPLVLEVREPA